MIYGTVEFVPVTTGLAPGAATVAVAALVCAIVLVRAAPAGRPPGTGRGYRALGFAAPSVAAGLAAAAGTARLAPGVSTMPLAGPVAVGASAAIVCALAGLLAQPGVAGAGRALQRHLLDGFVVAASFFYTSWTLLIEPMHRQYLHGSVPFRLTLRCLVVAGPTLVGIVAIGVLVAVAVKVPPARRLCLLAIPPIALVAALSATVFFDSASLLLTGSMAYALAVTGLAVAVRTHAARAEADTAPAGTLAVPADPASTRADPASTRADPASTRADAAVVSVETSARTDAAATGAETVATRSDAASGAAASGAAASGAAASGAAASGAAASGAAASEAAVATTRPEPTPAEPHGGLALSLGFVGLALVACVIRMIFFDTAIDSISVGTAVALGAALAAQQALARVDLRRTTQRLQRSEAHFRSMAYTDALTGLANRRQLLVTLAEEAVGGPACMLLAIDLDGFKNINDTRGHDVGDSVLVEVARRLRTNLRPGDLAVRMGGDEFAVLMWGGPVEAKAVADRIHGVLCQPYDLDVGSVFLSASVGLAGCATAETIEGLIRNADVALRFAKQRGKHRVEQYDLAYDQWLRRRTELEHELRGAVDRGELMLVYQPIVHLPTGRVAGVEALLRWHHPGLGTVPPDEFIPLAEDAGLISGLGTFVLDEACHQLSRWLSDGHEIYLAVNVSVRELHNPEYATQVSGVLRRHRVPPERLVVEVTEHAVALDIQQLVDRLTALRAAGVRVALDDFGSGYSSLGQLRTLPVDILKIDRALTAPAGLAPVRFAPPLADVVVQLGNRLGLDVVAEGITEEGQHKVLEEAGCRYAQGDLFGRPMPAERVEALFGVEPVAPKPREPEGTAQNVGPVDSGHEMRQS
jgi:diguanylate cyclase (GGDEF)-like protein